MSQAKYTQQNELPLPQLQKKYTQHHRSNTYSVNFDYPQLHQPLSSVSTNTKSKSLRKQRRRAYTENKNEHRQSRIKSEREQRQLSAYRSLKVQLKKQLDDLNEKKKNLEGLYEKKNRLRVKLDKLNKQLLGIKQIQHNYLEENSRISNSRTHGENAHYPEHTSHRQGIKPQVEKITMSRKRVTKPQYLNPVLNPQKSASKAKLKKKLLTGPARVIKSQQPIQLKHRCLQCCQFSLKREDIALKNIKGVGESIQSQKLFFKENPEAIQENEQERSQLNLIQEKSRINVEIDEQQYEDDCDSDYKHDKI